VFYCCYPASPVYGVTVPPPGGGGGSVVSPPSSVVKFHSLMEILLLNQEIAVLLCPLCQ
jgi:hypothetical protein